MAGGNPLLGTFSATGGIKANPIRENELRRRLTMQALAQEAELAQSQLGESARQFDTGLASRESENELAREFQKAILNQQQEFQKQQSQLSREQEQALQQARLATQQRGQDIQKGLGELKINTTEGIASKDRDLRRVLGNREIDVREEAIGVDASRVALMEKRFDEIELPQYQNITSELGKLKIERTRLENDDFKNDAERRAALRELETEEAKARKTKIGLEIEALQRAANNRLSGDDLQEIGKFLNGEEADIGEVFDNLEGNPDALEILTGILRNRSDIKEAAARIERNVASAGFDRERTNILKGEAEEKKGKEPEGEGTDPDAKIRNRLSKSDANTFEADKVRAKRASRDTFGFNPDNQSVGWNDPNVKEYRPAAWRVLAEMEGRDDAQAESNRRVARAFLDMTAPGSRYENAQVVEIAGGGIFGDNLPSSYEEWQSEYGVMPSSENLAILVDMLGIRDTVE